MNVVPRIASPFAVRLTVKFPPASISTGTGRQPPLGDAAASTSAGWIVSGSGKSNKTSLVGAAYLEFDLEAIFEGDLFPDFVLLYRLAHASRLAVRDADAGPSSCLLEQWRTEGAKQGERALAQLRAGVEAALEILGTGFLDHPENADLRQRIGVTLSEADFQRAVLNRIPKITAEPQRPWRDLLFVADEYHTFATVGETDPTGDERAFALSRQARLIPIVATQSVSSLRSALSGDEAWRTLLQCFRTKVFLATSDEFTARIAAELCGRADRLRARYTLAEGGQADVG